MSGLEVERIQERVNGMTEDQQRVIAAALPDEILWEAIYGRYSYLHSRMSAISQAIDC